MRALTIRQPWAFLIVAGEKPVENRSWSTPHRGRFWVHAAVNDATEANGPHEPRPLLKALGDRAVHGCIIGSVDLVDIVRDAETDWAEPGFFHWVLRDPVALPEPVPCRGALQLWTPPPGLGLPGFDEPTLF